MAFVRQVSRVLDDEHRTQLSLLGQVEQRLARPPGAADAALAALMRQLVQQLRHDVDRHFAFEEEALFPRLSEHGDGGMAALLADEHAVIREVAAELNPLAVAAGEGRLDAAGWRTLTQAAAELVERQVSHIQKETMALLPLLDELLDDEADRELAMAYAEG